MIPAECFTTFLFWSVWADHADYVSKAYSGTGALKTDFTRTGVRSKRGLLMDGQHSIVRYLKNNYFDGDRQVTAIVSEVVPSLIYPLQRYTGCIRSLHWSLDSEARASRWIIYDSGHSPSWHPLSTCTFSCGVAGSNAKPQMPYILAFSLFMIFAGLTLPRTSSAFESISNVIVSYKIPSSILARLFQHFLAIPRRHVSHLYFRARR